MADGGRSGGHELLDKHDQRGCTGSPTTGISISGQFQFCCYSYWSGPAYYFTPETSSWNGMAQGGVGGTTMGVTRGADGRMYATIPNNAQSAYALGPDHDVGDQRKGRQQRHLQRIKLWAERGQ